MTTLVRVYGGLRVHLVSACFSSHTIYVYVYGAKLGLNTTISNVSILWSRVDNRVCVTSKCF